MMARGRPPLGAGLVGHLEGSDQAKVRLKAILETLSAKRTVPDACRELGIGQSAFHKMRQRVLQCALSELEPAQLGRPPAEKTGDDPALAQLHEELTELRLQLQAARIREEIAVAMPRLLKPADESPKKGAKWYGKKGRRHRPGPPKGGTRPTTSGG
jgi:transposase-like protein